MSILSRFAACTAAFAVVAIATAPLAAQNTRYAISIGNHPDDVGLRINFRDRDLRRVVGANVTLWTPHEPASGSVRGLALGLPLTGAQDISGIATGVFGAGADRDLTGIAIGGLGVGAGGNVKGIVVGGLGAGAGGNATGILVGGVGAGIGGDLRGAASGAVGVGAGGDARGLIIGGVGAGAGGDLRGIGVGGIGMGIGGDLTGIAIDGVGAGSGGNARGIIIGGLGAGVGGQMRGLIIGGLGAGASELVGIGVGGLGVGGQNVRGFTATPGILRIESGGRFRRFSVNAAGSVIKGEQRGVVIGLINYARSVSGLQIGLINIIDSKRSQRVLPFINWED